MPTNIGAIVPFGAALALDAVLLTHHLLRPVKPPWQSGYYGLGIILPLDWMDGSLSDLEKIGLSHGCYGRLRITLFPIDNPVLADESKLAIYNGQNEGDGLSHDTIC